MIIKNFAYESFSFDVPFLIKLLVLTAEQSSVTESSLFGRPGSGYALAEPDDIGNFSIFHQELFTIKMRA